MMFHSPIFILGFLPICMAGFFTVGHVFGATGALGWLIAASLVFYGWWNPAFLPLLAGSVLVNYAITWKIRRTTLPRAWMAAGVTLNLAALGWFKYADFLLHIVVPAAPPLEITLPLAISFFTFQQVMVLVDTARQSAMARSLAATATIRSEINVSGAAGACQPVMTGTGSRATPGPFISSRSPRRDAFLAYAAFVTFFPHLIAGPIVRPAEIIPQLTAAGLGRARMENLAGGLLIFLLGLGKKCVLADMFGGFADTGFDATSHGVALTFFEAWYATLSYTLQIYFDFSGYSDIWPSDWRGC